RPERFFFVLPVRGNAVLGAPVHGVGADLQLDRLAFGPNHCCVQRLIEVELRHGDEIFESARHRIPGRVNDAERGVTVTDGIDQYTDAEQVVDVVEVPA